MNSLIVVRFWGRVDANELDQVRREIEAAPWFRPGLDRVWDQRECEIDVTNDDLRQLAERWAASDELHGDRRIGYLVSADLAWGFNRQFEAWRESHRPHVGARLFREYEPLKQWLGLPADLPDPAVLVPGADD